MNKDNDQLPANVRVLIALVAIPAYFSIFAAVFQLYLGEWEVSFSGLLYPALGVLAIYVALIGKLPKFFN